jgi:hypothetical protein
VFVGADAGRFNLGGMGNTFVGTAAGRSTVSGNNNTAIGFSADAFEGVTNATAIGANAVVMQSDSVILGNNASVGIGTSAPGARLDVRDGDILVGSPGQGIILKSPDGATCLRLTVSDAGVLTQTIVACLM